MDDSRKYSIDLLKMICNERFYSPVCSRTKRRIMRR